jgi:hypothetical protein
MARNVLVKVFGARREYVTDVTWERLPASMLKLLVAIAAAEKRASAPAAPGATQANPPSRTS